MKKNIVLMWTLTSLRVIVGWYFLYEGLSKLMTPGWTAQVYLSNSRWIFAGVFHQIAENQTDGVKYAFENGADFICVGMYDFQIVEDSNIVVDVLNSDFLSNRKRRWLVQA
jgi:hypothetical protein